MPSALTRRAPACLLLVGSLALAACSDGGAGVLSGRDGPQAAETPACTPAPLVDRAGAVLIVGLPGITDPDDPLVQQVVDLGVSGIFLVQENVASAAQVTALTSGIRERAGRPILVSTDEESGRVSVFRKIVGKSSAPRTMAARRTPEEVREIGSALGTELSALGVNLDLAPNLDLDDGPAGGIIGDRSWSPDPEKAATYGLAFARGLADSGVQPTVKHFPGHGRSAVDTHAGGDVVEASLDELRETDLLPFERAIDAGVPVVMLNHLAYSELDPDLPASVSPKAYALLREMGFEGVAITDSLGMGAVHSRWDFPEAAVRAIEAGGDVALGKDGRRAREMRDAIVQAVESGRLPEERLNEAAARATALAGGDPRKLACTDAAVPTLAEPAPTETATPSGSPATTTRSPSPAAE